MDLSLREEYLILSNKELKFSLIDEVNSFIKKCINTNNEEYLYKANCLIVDIYLENKDFDKPLKILLNNFNSIDKTIYKKNYVEILDRIIFIYITKQNYRLALKYLSIKEKFIDKNSNLQLNRLLLEKSYILAELNDIDKAIEALKDIVKNPTIDSLPYALSNLTKLYIDKKNIIQAEETLNRLLSLQSEDKESVIYSDYLLAKISVLKGNLNDACFILSNILENEDINQMTLPMVNDYLKLLFDLKRYDEMALYISKIALFINACDDLDIQKQFIKNKIRYFIVSKDYNRLSEAFNDLEIVDKKISDKERKISLEINELERFDYQNELINDCNDIVNNKEIDDLDSLCAIFNNNKEYNLLRDLIMEFCESLKAVIEFDEATFILINKPVNIELIPQTDLEIIRYKNSRVYEKALTESCLFNSIAFDVINQNKAISVDLNDKAIDCLNLFNNRSYREDKINYIHACPCIHNDSIFGIMVFGSESNNITDKSNSISLDFACKVLEANVYSYNLRELLNITDVIVNKTVSNNNIGLIKYNDDEMYLSNSLVSLFRLKSNFVKRSKFLELISKTDYERYLRNSGSDNYNIKYRINMDSVLLNVSENVQTFFDNNDKALFKFGTITILEGSIQSLIDGKALLKERIDEINKVCINDLEYRFSIVMMRTLLSDYDLIKLTLGVEPYFINDSDCVVILENEVNVRDIDNKVSQITDNYTIVRYPRDITSVNNVLDILNIMFESNEKYYNEIIYKEHLQMNTANKLASKLLVSDNRMPLEVIRYNSFDYEMYIEANLYFENDYKDIKIRNLLNEDNKVKYDIKLFRSIIDNNITANCLLFVSLKSLQKIIDRGLLNEVHNNIYFVLSSVKQGVDINGLIKEASEYANIIVSNELLNNVSVYSFSKKYVKGIFLTKLNSEEESMFIKDIVNKYNLIVFSRKVLNESFTKNIYATDVCDKLI